MKKFCLTSLVAFGLFTTQMLVAETTVVAIQETTQDLLNDFFQGKLGDAAVQFPSGTLLPLQLFIEGDLLALEGAESASLQVEVKKDFYLKFDKGAFLFSSNLESWYPLLHFVTGKTTAALQIVEGVPVIGLGLELYERQQ